MKTKKEMKTVTDPFAYAILDGKQLALKVTCNSVYGQTGASISKIYKKAIYSFIPNMFDNFNNEIIHFITTIETLLFKHIILC